MAVESNPSQVLLCQAMKQTPKIPFETTQCSVNSHVPIFRLPQVRGTVEATGASFCQMGEECG